MLGLPLSQAQVVQKNCSGLILEALANTHSWDQCLQLSRRWHSLKSGAFSDAFINGGTGLSIEALPFVGLKGVPDLLMQLKMVL